MRKKAGQNEKVSKTDILAALQRLPDQVWYVWDFSSQTVAEGEAELSRFHGWKLEDLLKRPGGWLATIHPGQPPQKLTPQWTDPGSIPTTITGRIPDRRPRPRSSRRPCT